jgi:hypothetical protein
VPTKILITTLYPGLGPTQRKNLAKLGLRFHHDYVEALARKRNTDAFAKRIGVECATCLGQGYTRPTGPRKPTAFCGCAIGFALERKQNTRRAARKQRSVYAVQVIGGGVYGAPQDQRFDSWQKAYAEVRRVLQTVTAGSLVDVVKRDHNADEYRLVGRWEVDEREFWRVQ